MKGVTGKFLSLVLAVATVASMAVPTTAVSAFAAEGDETASAKVYVTISDKGVIAKDKDGAAMTAREVAVNDLDADGHLTVDEALVAAHTAYCADGAEGYNQANGTVKKLWGTETTNTLFFVNGEGIPSGVTADEVVDGDAVYASVNSDSTYYADWYTEFDQTAVTLQSGAELTVNIKGHLGMAYTDEEKKNVALSDIQLGTWKDGAFTPLEGAVTDADGNATVSFDEAGTYVLTATGAVEGVVTDWNLMNYKTNDYTVDGTAFVSYDWSTYDTFVAYTDEDYGDGPYPAAELKKIPMYDDEGEETEWETLHYLKSNQLIADCPIMAPFCIVSVDEKTPEFSDVTDPDTFYYAPVYWAAGKGIVSGWDDGTFRPWNNCNRAAVVTFLWRMAGKPEPTKTDAFSDMTSNEEFNKAICWAAEKGITSGWSDGTFRPWNTCNRAAVVTFLWRYAGKPEAASTASFSDMTENAEFNAAISWAAEEGITSGWNDGTFRPWNTCNRAAIVSFLYRYMVEDKAEPEIIDLTITNNTSMFKAVTAYVEKTDDATVLVMALSGSGYKELFKGTYDAAVANGDEQRIKEMIPGFMDTPMTPESWSSVFQSRKAKLMYLVLLYQIPIIRNIWTERIVWSARSFRVSSN